MRGDRAYSEQMVTRLVGENDTCCRGLRRVDGAASRRLKVDHGTPTNEAGMRTRGRWAHAMISAYIILSRRWGGVGSTGKGRRRGYCACLHGMTVGAFPS
jgi:hypothetical protein